MRKGINHSYGGSLKGCDQRPRNKTQGNTRDLQNGDVTLEQYAQFKIQTYAQVAHTVHR
jgi:hypothetical protein